MTLWRQSGVSAELFAVEKLLKDKIRDEKVKEAFGHLVRAIRGLQVDTMTLAEGKRK